MLLLPLALAVGYVVVSKRGRAVASQTAPEPISHRESPRRKAIASVPPGQLRDVVRNDGLAKPDGRFVAAAETVARLLGGKSGVAARVTIRDRRFTIDVGRKPDLELSTIPSFEEALEALRRLAAGGPSPSGGEPLAPDTLGHLESLASRAFDNGPLEALVELDRLWWSGRDRKALVDLASLATTTMELQRLDSLELSDLPGGNALGLLAVAEASAGKRHLDREALLALCFGYVTEARDIARRLPPEDPMRLYVLHEHAALRGTASSASSSDTTRYMYAICLAGTAKPDEFESWLDEHGGIGREAAAAIKLRLFLSAKPWGSSVDLYGSLLRAVLRDIGVQPAEPPRAILETFECAMQTRPRGPGPFFDGDVEAAHERALFYSGLFGIGKFYLDTLSSGGAASQFAELLEGAEPGPARDFKGWYDDLTAFKNGELPIAQLFQKLSIPALGQYAYRRAESRLDDMAPYTPERMFAAGVLARSLDSRPGNLRHVAHIAGVLSNPVAEEEYYSAHAARTGTEGQDIAAWIAFTLEDGARLRALAQDHELSKSARCQALDYLQQLDLVSDEELSEMLLKLAAGTIEDGTVVSVMSLLRKVGRLRDAETLARTWQRTHPDEQPLTQTIFAARLAHALHMQGRFEEAWAAIEPWIATGKGDAYWAGAEALEGVGRHEEALRMARAGVERYPDSAQARADLAQILWLQGRFEEAPKPLLDPRHPLVSSDWVDTVALDFFEVYARRPVAEASAAFDPLIRAGVNPWFLFEFCEPFAKAKRFDVAIALIDALIKSRNAPIDPWFRAYNYRRRSIGADAADRWFRETVVPRPDAEQVAGSALDAREFDLLWSFPDTDNAWILRAQAEAYDPGRDPKRREAVVAHFRDAKAPLDGRYLIGAEPEERLLASATDLARRCEVSYLIGLKALGENRLVDASDWFRVSINSGLRDLWSFHRTEECLRGWHAHKALMAARERKAVTTTSASRVSGS